jgi:hypothetical protein
MKIILLSIVLLTLAGCDYYNSCVPEGDVEVMQDDYLYEIKDLTERLESKEEAYDYLVDCVIDEYNRLDIIYACEY